MKKLNKQHHQISKQRNTMKRNVKLFQAITLSAAALLAPLLLGCQDTLVEEKVDAKNRWLELRSSMMLDMAKQQFASGDLRQAEKSVKDGMSIDPTHAGLHILAGRISLEQSKLERAFHLFNAAIELEPENAEAYYYQGLVMQRWQRYEKSLDFYQQAYDNDLDNPAYLLAVTETLVDLDRVDQAITLLESKRQYFDQNAGVRAAIGHLYYMKGKPEIAADNFREATLLEPGSIRFKEQYAFSLAAAGKHEQAIPGLTELLEKPDQKDRADLKRALVSAYQHTGQDKEAHAILIELARSPQGDVSDWIRLGELSYKQDELGGALQAASKVMSLSPKRHEGYLLAGMVWQKRGNLNNALQMFDRAAAAAPASSEALILRGLSLQKAGRFAAAAQAYQQALNRKPGDTRARQLLAAVSEQGG
jgi:tetratricopeptide (TPR) repeat protein